VQAQALLATVATQATSVAHTAAPVLAVPGAVTAAAAAGAGPTILAHVIGTLTSAAGRAVAAASPTLARTLSSTVEAVPATLSATTRAPLSGGGEGAAGRPPLASSDVRAGRPPSAGLGPGRSTLRASAARSAARSQLDEPRAAWETCRGPTPCRASSAALLPAPGQAGKRPFIAGPREGPARARVLTPTGLPFAGAERPPAGLRASSAAASGGSGFARGSMPAAPGGLLGSAAGAVGSGPSSLLLLAVGALALAWLSTQRRFPPGTLRRPRAPALLIGARPG
jgi:hypothetical protein